MWEVLAAVSALQWVAIGLSALASGTTLLAAGSVMVERYLFDLSLAARRHVLRHALWAGLAAAVATALALPVQAMWLAGGQLSGATDPVLLGLLVHGPEGDVLFARILGLGLLGFALQKARLAGAAVAGGLILVFLSFALEGHTLEEPRAVLLLLIMGHMAALAFWLGAFAPLLYALRHTAPNTAGEMAQRFGQSAIWGVTALVVAGLTLLLLLSGMRLSVVTTPYGLMFLAKLCLFAGVFVLAARNKLRLTPALCAGAGKAEQQLRQAIYLEALLIGGIILLTATITATSSPAI